MSQSIPDVVFPEKPLPKRTWNLQFSIRGLLITTAVIAFLLGAIAVPEVFAIVGCIALVALTPILVTTIVVGRGWIRAFAAGALVPNLLTYLAVFEGFGSPQGALFVVVLSFLASFIIGGITAFTHGYLKRRAGKIAIPNVPFVRDWLSNE